MGNASGIDVSSWQHSGGPIDWPTVRTEGGKTFALIKCTQGVDYVNPYFKDDLREARSAGILVGAYHFAQPGQNAAADEAAHALATLQGVGLDLGLWLDFEQLGSLPVHEAWAWVEAFLSAVTATFPGGGLYTDQSLLTAMVNAPGPYPLWIADPSGTYQGSALVRQGAEGTCPGIVGPVDLDTLTTTRAVNPGPPPAPPVPPVPPPAHRRHRHPSHPSRRLHRPHSHRRMTCKYLP